MIVFNKEFGGSIFFVSVRLLGKMRLDASRKRITFRGLVAGTAEGNTTAFTKGVDVDKNRTRKSKSIKPLSYSERSAKKARLKNKFLY